MKTALNPFTNSLSGRNLKDRAVPGVELVIPSELKFAKTFGGGARWTKKESVLKKTWVPGTSRLLLFSKKI